MRHHPLIIRTQLFIRYLRFLIAAKTRYDIDSPFVTEFITHVLEDRRQFYAFPLIEWIRRLLWKDKTEISITDHGAGSRITKKSVRTIRHIVRHGAISRRQGQYLFKIALYYQPSKIVELGTSLGISTLYLALTDSRRPVVTVEGSEEIARKAAETFYRLKLKNISIINDTFQKALTVIREEWKNIDLLYLDGDHRSGSSLQYFEYCLPLFHEKSILVLADIYWSEEMQQAWQKIKSHSSVTVALDLFDFGILFFDPGIREKISVKLVPVRYKPWRIGLMR